MQKRFGDRVNFLTSQQKFEDYISKLTVSARTAAEERVRDLDDDDYIETVDEKNQVSQFKILVKFQSLKIIQLIKFHFCYFSKSCFGT